MTFSDTCGMRVLVAQPHVCPVQAVRALCAGQLCTVNHFDALYDGDTGAEPSRCDKSELSWHARMARARMGHLRHAYRLRLLRILSYDF